MALGNSRGISIIELVLVIALVAIMALAAAPRLANITGMKTAATARTLQSDFVYAQSRDQAQRAIFEYIEVFYNRTRRHTSIGNLSPMDFELQRAKAA